MTYLKPGDTVRRCDDSPVNSYSHGTVLKISDQPRRDMTGEIHTEWSPMVFIQWQRTRLWEAPELLVKVESP